VQSSMLHGSETRPVRKENEMVLQRAELRMVRWMCGVKLKDSVLNKELRERPEIDDSLDTTTKQTAMVWACVVKRRQ